MPKPSAWLQQQQAKIDAMISKTARINQQMMCDCAVIAFVDVCEEITGQEVTKDQANQFLTALETEMHEFSALVVNDSKPISKGGNGDEHMNYAKGKLDSTLERIFGKGEVPIFEERYGY